jgi:hypothetical protein
MIKNLVFSKIEEGGESILFDPPLLVEYETIVDNGKVFIVYDFGMTGFVNIGERLFFFNKDDKLSLKEKVEQIVSFDLFHAFCHCSFDPNYTYLHWALYGNLKDRVTINEKNKETADKLGSLSQDS